MRENQLGQQLENKKKRTDKVFNASPTFRKDCINIPREDLLIRV